jgi:hypothetical protein
MLLGLIAIIGLAADIALVLTNYRLSQAALDGAALAAANAVDRHDTNGVITLELRLAPRDGLPSAYALAQDYVDQYGNGRVVMTDVVSDGQRVLVFGAVASPTLFARLVGLGEVRFGLVSSAELAPLPTQVSP